MLNKRWKEDTVFSMTHDEVSIRLLQEEHSEYLRKWRNNPEVNKGFLTRAYLSKEAQQRWYAAYKEKDNDYMFVIYYKNNLVGCGGIYHIDFSNKKGEFGRMLIGELECRGKGVGTLGAGLICDAARRYLGLKTIELEVLKDNKCAYNIYKKLGFVPVSLITKDNQSVWKMVKTSDD